MWLIFSQISAILDSIENLLFKKVSDKLDSSVITFYFILTSLILLIPLTLVNGIPDVKEKFWLYLTIRVIIDSLALYCYINAVSKGDLSKIVPLFSFSAVFSTIFSLIINQEVLTILNVLGISIIVFGTYILNIEQANSHFLAPLKYLFNDSASRLMLTSTLLYGLVFTFSKPAIENSSTLFYTTSAAFCLMIVFFINSYFKTGKNFKFLKLRTLIRLMPIGFIDGIKIFTFMQTINLAYVGFADASNNTTSVYSALFGKLFYKEKIKDRILGICIMLIGVIILTLF